MIFKGYPGGTQAETTHPEGGNTPLPGLQETGTQVYRYTGIQVYRYTGIQVDCQLVI